MPYLYHYTTAASAAKIAETGLLQPTRIVMPRKQLDQQPDWTQELFDLVWLTDLDEPMRDALGLTMYGIKHDRTEARLLASPADPIPWTKHRRMCHPRLVDSLETAPGAMPRHWWVSLKPVPARLLPREHDAQVSLF